MGISVYCWVGGGSDHPPYCLRSSSRLGLAPFVAAPVREDDGALPVGRAGGLCPGRLGATSGLGRGCFRKGRSGLTLLDFGAPFGFPGGALIVGVDSTFETNGTSELNVESVVGRCDAFYEAVTGRRLQHGEAQCGRAPTRIVVAGIQRAPFLYSQLQSLLYREEGRGRWVPWKDVDDT